MPQISGLRIDFSRSPRVATIPAPIVSAEVQDIYDTLRFKEEHPSFGLSYPDLVRAGGKEVIGANLVGITLTLLDCRIAFEQRTTPTSTGGATSNDTLGVTLVDTGADFVVDGLVPGDTVWNTTDLSFATILEVVDANTLVHVKLDGGSDNQWAISDAYRVYKTVQCEVVGGNLVAVAADGVTPINEIHPTAFTQVATEKSTSPSIAAKNIADDIWDEPSDEHNEPDTMGRKVRSRIV
jgi:hypothetical protein